MFVICQVMFLLIVIVCLLLLCTFDVPVCWFGFFGYWVASNSSLLVLQRMLSSLIKSIMQLCKSQNAFLFTGSRWGTAGGGAC